jgi:flagellar motor switch protein FliN/FliY
MTVTPVSALDLTAALAEAVRVLLPYLPADAGPADVAVVTSDELAGIDMSYGAAGVAVRTGGAVQGDVALLVAPEVHLARTGEPGAADALALWQPAVDELVAALAGQTGPLDTEPARAVDPAAVLAAGPAGLQWAVALMAEDRPLAVVVVTAAPQALGPAGAAPELAAFQPLTGGSSVALDPRRLHLLRDVAMEVSVELGRTRMTVRELLALAPGTIVQLDRAAGSPVDLLVNGTLLARGEVVVVDEEFAVRISEIVGPDAENRLGS